MKKLLLIPMFLCTGMVSPDPDDLNDRPTIEGALINLNELQEWIQVDYEKGHISYKDAELYYSVLEITKKQLKKYDKQNN